MKQNNMAIIAGFVLLMLIAIAVMFAVGPLSVVQTHGDTSWSKQDLGKPYQCTRVAFTEPIDAPSILPNSDGEFSAGFRSEPCSSDGKVGGVYWQIYVDGKAASYLLPADGYPNTGSIAKITYEAKNLTGGNHIIQLVSKFIDNAGVPGLENLRGSVVMYTAEVYKEDNLCSVPEGYLIATEDRKGFIVSEAKINSGNTRYPVEAWCTNPTIFSIVKLGTDGSTKSSVEEYDLLRAGKNVVVPENETWRIKYIVQRNKLLQFDCESAGNLFDADSQTCNARGFLDECSGTINDKGECITTIEDNCPGGVIVNGTCVVPPVYNLKCAYFGTYVVDLDKCRREPIGQCRPTETLIADKICEFEPEATCNDAYGSQLSADHKYCEFSASGFNNCNVQGPEFSFDFSTNRCSDNPNQFCPDGFEKIAEAGLIICREPRPENICDPNNEGNGYIYNQENNKCQRPADEGCPPGYKATGQTGEDACIKEAVPGTAGETSGMQFGTTEIIAGIVVIVIIVVVAMLRRK